MALHEMIDEWVLGQGAGPFDDRKCYDFVQRVMEENEDWVAEYLRLEIYFRYKQLSADQGAKPIRPRLRIVRPKPEP